MDIHIANLGEAYLGLQSGNNILIDANAAGWGWFVDPTPHDDSEFITPGDQGEQNHMDLLTVLMHEMGHLLGLDHDADGVMQETLTTGTRRLPTTTEALGTSSPSPVPLGTAAQDSYFARLADVTALAGDVSLAIALALDPAHWADPFAVGLRTF